MWFHANVAGEISINDRAGTTPDDAVVHDPVHVAKHGAMDDEVSDLVGLEPAEHFVPHQARD
jgi:hypothetical protein